MWLLYLIRIILLKDQLIIARIIATNIIIRYE